MMWKMMYYGFGGLVILLFWTILLLGGSYLIYQMIERKKMDRTSENVLRERFARGELGMKEYKEKLNLLLKKR